MDEGTDALMDGWRDIWNNGRMDEGTDALMDGWMKGHVH